MLDQDDRELRLIKEAYLENGDLHSDGGGRQRRFRWQNNVDVEESGGLQLSDGDADHTDDINEQQWRRSRFERERFLDKSTKVSMDLTFRILFPVTKILVGNGIGNLVLLTYGIKVFARFLPLTCPFLPLD